ncbi:MAG: hypothetical protein IPH44_29095 [Myxococcales bacterium]|nr:hypothetical protein [Myxococcales bacterium]MBK7191329.1 hypothetical protein [Myxococcales bacterium]
MSNDEDDEWINCDRHGRGRCAIVCTHHVQQRVQRVGFVENSDDPNDLQAWCFACEQFFASEGELTEAFRAFNDAFVVCVPCYYELRQSHWLASA